MTFAQQLNNNFDPTVYSDLWASSDYLQEWLKTLEINLQPATDMSDNSYASKSSKKGKGPFKPSVSSLDKKHLSISPKEAFLDYDQVSSSTTEQMPSLFAPSHSKGSSQAAQAVALPQQSQEAEASTAEASPNSPRSRYKFSYPRNAVRWNDPSVPPPPTEPHFDPAQFAQFRQLNSGVLTNLNSTEDLYSPGAMSIDDAPMLDESSYAVPTGYPSMAQSIANRKGTPVPLPSLDSHGNLSMPFLSKAAEESHLLNRGGMPTESLSSSDSAPSPRDFTYFSSESSTERSSSFSSTDSLSNSNHSHNGPNTWLSGPPPKQPATDSRSSSMLDLNKGMSASFTAEPSGVMAPPVKEGSSKSTERPQKEAAAAIPSGAIQQPSESDIGSLESKLPPLRTADFATSQASVDIPIDPSFARDDSKGSAMSRSNKPSDMRIDIPDANSNGFRDDKPLELFTPRSVDLNADSSVRTTLRDEDADSKEDEEMSRTTRADSAKRKRMPSASTVSHPTTHSPRGHYSMSNLNAPLGAAQYPTFNPADYLIGEENPPPVTSNRQRRVQYSNDDDDDSAIENDSSGEYKEEAGGHSSEDLEFDPDQPASKKKRRAPPSATSSGASPAPGKSTSAKASTSKAGATPGNIYCDHIDPATGKQCGTVFRRPYDLARHKDTIHGGKEKPSWVCSTCKHSFSRKDALLRHTRIRGHG